MTFTYLGTLKTDLDKVRSRIGDTDSEDALLTDEEINGVLAEVPDVSQAAVECCELILAELARRVNRSAAGISSSASAKYDQYERLLKTLRRRARSRTVKPFVGQISQARNESTDNDSGYEKPTFKVGMGDYGKHRGRHRDKWDDT